MGLSTKRDVQFDQPKVQGQISCEGILRRIWRRLRRNVFTGGQNDNPSIQLDVKTTFLHGDLKEEIYMEQAKVFVASGQEHLVCRHKEESIRPEIGTATVVHEV